MSRFFLLLCLMLLGGCGSVSTLAVSDQAIIADLSKARTHCTTLPRLYSGVAYDLCQVHSSSTNPARHLAYSFYLFDILPSAAVDTLSLPYTAYQQQRSGSLSLQPVF